MVITNIMNIIDDINTSHVGVTAHGIGLCYFDPTQELLVEFSNNNINITPFEKSVKRYYLVVTDFTNLPYRVNIQFTSNLDNLIVKHKVKQNNTLLTNKYEYENILESNYSSIMLSQHPSGIVPIDVYFESISHVNYNGSLIVTLDVDYGV